MEAIYTVELTRQTISDLFFNHEHFSWNAMYANENSQLSQDVMREAITEDAAEFLRVVPQFEVLGITKEMLADDFLARL